MLVIRLDNRIVQLIRNGVEDPQRRKSPRTHAHRAGWPPTDHRRSRLSPFHGGRGEPMQLGRAQLTQEERLKRQLEGWCFYCGETGHLVVTRPATRSMAVSHATVYGPRSRTLTKVQVGGKSKATSRDKTSLSRYFLAWRLRRKILIVLWDAHGKEICHKSVLCPPSDYKSVLSDHTCVCCSIAMVPASFLKKQSSP
ncbi:uncharacterized protein AB9X84_013428 isoform 1-T1 [Acanthopagrus schlegelii]